MTNEGFRYIYRREAPLEGRPYVRNEIRPDSLVVPPDTTSSDNTVGLCAGKGDFPRPGTGSHGRSDLWFSRVRTGTQTFPYTWWVRCGWGGPVELSGHVPPEFRPRRESSTRCRGEVFR